MRMTSLPLGLRLGIAISFFTGIPLIFVWRYLPGGFFLRSILAAAFAVVVCLWVTRWLVDRPIRELIREMDEAERHDFLNRASVTSDDVIGDLAQSFNLLLERITTLDAFKLESERQLIAAREELKFQEALQQKSAIIEKANRDLETSLRELDLIHEFSHKIVSTLDLDRLYEMLDELLGEKIGFREFALLVRDGDSEEVVVQVARGFADTSRVRGMRFGSGEGLTGVVFKSREVCYIPDTRLEPRYLYYKGEKREDGSFLSIPLLFKERLVGILNFTRPGADAFNPQEIQFLKTIAVEVAVALVNASLYSKTRELSVRDELTGLYNRRHFREVLPMEIKRAERFRQSVSLLMIDIDRFKNYNDTFGHLEGDNRLRDLSRFLIASIREVDFTARFGGEEFVIVLPNTAKEDAVRVAEKLNRLVRSHPFPRRPGDSGEVLTLSIGVSSYPSDGKGIDDLVDAADQALYQAKGAGRDRVIPFSAPPSPVADPASTASSSPGFAGGRQGGMSA